MSKTRLIYNFFFCLLLISLRSEAQEIIGKMREAQQLEKTHREEEALAKYLEIVSSEPANIFAACKVSELYTTLGKRQSTREKQKEYYRLARNYAQRALKINPNSSEANFVMAVAMGRMALISTGEEKIKAVKDIKSFAEKSIQLDARNYKGYHVLGKWYYEVSDLSSVEKWLVKVTYGALPKATLEDAIRYYEKSTQLNPSFLLNYLELARSYQRKNESNKAVQLLNTVLKMPSSSVDDALVKAEAKKLLQNLK